MSQPAKDQATIQMRDFPGLQAQMDPVDIEDGAARMQINTQPIYGVLQSRRGLQKVSFEQTLDISVTS